MNIIFFNAVKPCKHCANVLVAVTPLNVHKLLLSKLVVLCIVDAFLYLKIKTVDISNCHLGKKIV